MEARTELEDYKAYLESQAKPGWQVIFFKLRNDRSHPLTVIAEPWGTSVTVSSGEECEVLAEEPKGYALDMTFSDDYVQLWADGHLEIFQAGEGYGITGEYVDWQQQWRNKNP
jgi:hypothetical protein